MLARHLEVCGARQGEIGGSVGLRMSGGLGIALAHGAEVGGRHAILGNAN